MYTWDNIEKPHICKAYLCHLKAIPEFSRNGTYSHQCMLSSSNRLSICTAVLSFTAQATHRSLSGDRSELLQGFQPRYQSLCFSLSLSLSCSMEREEEGPWQHSDFIDNGGIVFLRDNMWCSREFSKKIASREFLQQRKGLTFKVHEKKILIHQPLLLFTY